MKNFISLGLLLTSSVFAKDLSCYVTSSYQFVQDSKIIASYTDTEDFQLEKTNKLLGVEYNKSFSLDTAKMKVHAPLQGLNADQTQKILSDIALDFEAKDNLKNEIQLQSFTSGTILKKAEAPIFKLKVYGKEIESAKVLPSGEPLKSFGKSVESSRKLKMVHQDQVKTSINRKGSSLILSSVFFKNEQPEIEVKSKLSYECDYDKASNSVNDSDRSSVKEVEKEKSKESKKKSSTEQ